MKNEKFSQAMSGLDERFVREANLDVNAWLSSMEGEPVIVNKAKKASPWKIMASAACTAAALFGVFVLAKNVISLREPNVSASSGGFAEPDNSESTDGLVTKNYFGGVGELKGFHGGAYGDYDYIVDNSSIYANFDSLTSFKYNKNTNTLSLICHNPSCDHSNKIMSCKARMSYLIFNGELIGIYKENLYLFGEDDKPIYKYDKPIYKNKLPEGIAPDTHNNYIEYAFTLADDYLVLHNGGYIYILDKDFNIAYTVIGYSPYGGGVYYVDNEIYYIDGQFRLRKLDMESGGSTLVDLGGMNIWEGFVEDDVLWFSNGDALCSYDFKTGEIKEHAKSAVRLARVGKYIKYMIYNVGDVYLYDPETGETQKREDFIINEDRLFFLDGVYYRYNDEKGELTLYEEDLTTVIRSCTLGE